MFSGQPSAPSSRIAGPFGFEFGCVVASSVVFPHKPGSASLGWRLKTLLLKPESLTGMLNEIVVPG